MKHDVIIGDFTESERIIVFSANHLYNGKYGNIQRLGSAGNVIYYHIILDGVLTPITFMRRQIQKA